METPPPGTQPPADPVGQQPAAPHQTGFYAGIRRIGLWRSDDHWFGGVAGGLAERLGVDALVVRGIFVVTVLLGGVGLLAYGIGWLLLPHRRDGRILLEEVLAGRFDLGFLGALTFTIVGLSRGGGWLVGWPGMPHGLRAVGGLLWLGLLAVVVAFVVAAISSNRSGRTARTGGQPPAGAPWTAPPAPGPGSGAPTTGWGTSSAATTPAGPTATSPTAVYPTTAYPAATNPAPTYPTHTYPTHTYPAPTYPSATYASATSPTQVPPTRPASTATTGVVPPTGRYAPATVAPKAPRKPRTRGPGVATVGAVVALSLLTLAGLLLAHRAGDFDGPIVLTALGVAIVLAGLGIVVSGLRGRTSGVLGFLAIVGLLVSVPLGIVARSDWTSGGEHHAVAYDVSPVTRYDAERGWSFAVGDSTVDLTRVPLTDETLSVPVSLGAGDLTIVVPSSDVAVDADVRLGAGTITWDVGDGSSRQVSGGNLHEHFSSLSGVGSHQIHLRVSAGAGDVVIEQEHS